eukprot:GEMP01039519.1.p1 GENE.GEMP01039519.1~~GEMP01039519.1.p1  ORF type:complete len:383 (+),score=85.62 GEMP01039519.1:141-1289(+)
MSVVCYWEKQGADKLCAVHCLNAVVQGPQFSAGELGDIARELDTQELNLGLSSAEGSQNVDASGNFSISVIERAIARQGLQAVNLDRTDIKQSVYRKCTEQAFICNSHARAHWFSLRKVLGRWWNLDSLAPTPATIGEFGLIAFLESTIQSGFTIFVIRSLEHESIVDLPDPVPSTPRTSPHQYYLTERQIDELRAAAARGEQHSMDEARALTDEAPERPAFTVIAPSGKKPAEPTDWSKLGQGASLGGPQGSNSDDMDDELQAALRASLDTIPQPPPEAPEGQGTIIQVRMPKGGKLQRRWLLTRSMLELCGWLEYVSVKDASHGIPPLPTCNYVLIKQGFPKKDKFEKKDGSVILDGQDVSAYTLEQLKFSRQEALILQL